MLTASYVKERQKPLSTVYKLQRFSSRYTDFSYFLANSKLCAAIYMSNGCPLNLLPLLASDPLLQIQVQVQNTPKIQHQTEVIMSLEMQKMFVWLNFLDVILP